MKNNAGQGKNINLFLINGSVTGCIKCTLANWTGIAYKIPRTELDNCKNREDLKQSAVYFLFGKSEDKDEDVVYIGQACARKNGEGILNRLYEHKRDSQKDYWTEAIVFITSNKSFGPTEITYLENRFVVLANEVNRYIVKNDKEPSAGTTTEEKECELEEFIENAMLLIGTLGHKLFISKNDVPSVVKKEIVPINEEPTLYLSTGKAKATGKRTSDGFVVFQNSELSLAPTKSCPQAIKTLREKKRDKISAKNKLTEDILFSSPSTAAAFIMYSSANGLVSWKTKDGKTLKELESKDI